MKPRKKITAMLTSAGVVDAMMKGYPSERNRTQAMKVSLSIALKNSSEKWSNKRLIAHIRKHGIYSKLVGFRFRIRTI